MTTLADRLIEAREAAGMDKAALQRAVRPHKLTHSALSQLESGKSKSMKAETAFAIARATGFRAEYLVLNAKPKRAGERAAVARLVHSVNEPDPEYAQQPAASGLDKTLLQLILEQVETLPSLNAKQRAEVAGDAYEVFEGDDKLPTRAAILRLIRPA